MRSFALALVALVGLGGVAMAAENWDSVWTPDSYAVSTPQQPQTGSTTPLARADTSTHQTTVTQPPVEQPTAVWKWGPDMVCITTSARGNSFLRDSVQGQYCEGSACTYRWRGCYTVWTFPGPLAHAQGELAGDFCMNQMLSPMPQLCYR